MAEESLDPIPKELCYAFWGAIGQYVDWCRGQSEPDVSLDGRPVAISTVCEFVSKFDDPMPANLCHLLANARRGAEDDLPNDQSYGSGARYLARLIRERKAHFDRLDQG
jgi:hypothetical protein